MLALCVAYGALACTGSRGCHAREDFPEGNNHDWLKRTLISSGCCGARWAGTLSSTCSNRLDDEGCRRLLIDRFATNTKLSSLALTTLLLETASDFR
jgi:hypothetical protein